MHITVVCQERKGVFRANVKAEGGGGGAEKKKGVPSAESSRSMRGLGKGVSGKPYPRLSNARRPRLKHRTFRSQAVRLYCLHQARPSKAEPMSL